MSTNHKRSEFNEATRVQMPALVHLTRLGYEYYGKIKEEDAGRVYDSDTNILIEIFKQQFAKLNPEQSGRAEETLSAIRQELDNDDLGHSFYDRLISASPIKLIDFDNPGNNAFHCTTEFTCKRDEDEFRPDITLFVNGLPLVFIEVKKPNNHDGMIAESERMNKVRFPNKKFRRFINITQLMIFSNNMEYDSMGGIVPIQGVFYCTAARDRALFNCFREENPGNNEVAPFIDKYQYRPINDSTEYRILSDSNCTVIHNAQEYQTNLDVNTPTNRVLTSMCCPERILFLLKYGIAYVHSEKEVDGKIVFTDEKHIMRYQQMFAALAVRKKLSEGVKSGIIWHTQGSGKTALSYHLNYVLSDFYSKQNKVAKFYFIVDRLDLLKQAKDEFEARGLVVKTANTREELMGQFRNNQSQTGNTGKNEITVVNIQRFEEDHEKVILSPYATNLQRIFIVDEAHRGYKPEGSFLANLFDADPNSIKIALTGTPLLKKERASWKVFGEYLHTYYYDRSIQDGYTLKIIREDIETYYRERLSEVYKLVETLVKKADIKKERVFEHEKYVKELLRYVISDLKKFHQIKGDETLGGMIICETSEQARKLFSYFDEIQSELNEEVSLQSHFKAGLILYDSDDKETRDRIIHDFKKTMTIDILIVYNMLLTGFDAPRLKRLYLGRKLKDHNLLQAITRVNRPYKDNRYGYVVDFADISKNYRETNEAYLRELNRFNDPGEVGVGNTIDAYAQVLENPDDLIHQMEEVRQVLFNYSVDNVEEFCSEISAETDKEKLLKLRNVLRSARDCCNLVRTFGSDELKTQFASLEITKVSEMITELNRRIDIINQMEAFSDNYIMCGVINDAMENIQFNFSKVGEEELEMVSGGEKLQEQWNRTVHAFADNIDQEDPEYISLCEAFKQRFKEYGFVVQSMDEFHEHSATLDEIYKKLQDIKKRNDALLKKYNGDVKFARVHKRISEENASRKESGTAPIVSDYDEKIMNILLSIKTDIDEKVYDKNDILKKDAYFEQTVMRQISIAFKNAGIENTDREDRVFLQSRISRQYLEQYNATYPAA